MGGDSNARTGKLGAEMELDREGREDKEDMKRRKRKSTDKKVNKEEKTLIDFLEERR